METGLFVLKSLSNLSLVFLIVNFIFGLISRVPPWHLFLFLGEIVLSLFAYYLKKQKHRKMYLVLFLLAAVPLPFFLLADIPYVLINSLAALYVGSSGIKLKNDYWPMTEMFGKGIVIVVFLTLLMVVRGNATNSENYTSYILIFLITSVYLLRTLRHLIYNDTEQELWKINLSYSLVTLLASFIVGSAAVRGFLGYILSRAYEIIVRVLIYTLSHLLLPLSYLLERFINGLHAMSGQKKPQQIAEIQGSTYDPTAQSAFNNPTVLLKLQHILQVSVNIVIVLLLLYGLYKLLRRFNSDSGQKTEEYRESRESILSSGERPSRFPKISGIFAHRNGVEAIRHYYRQFLQLSLKREIIISHSDTTLEIKKKGGTLFDKDVLEAMRTIYLQVRYGSKPCGEETVKTFRSLFKRLNKGK